jgi:hypothetical protein
VSPKFLVYAGLVASFALGGAAAASAVNAIHPAAGAAPAMPRFVGYATDRAGVRLAVAYPDAGGEGGGLRWLREGQTAGGFTAVRFDAKRECVIGSYRGLAVELALPDAHVRPLAAATRSSPATADATNPPSADMETIVREVLAEKYPGKAFTTEVVRSLAKLAGDDPEKALALVQDESVKALIESADTAGQAALREVAREFQERRTARRLAASLSH